MHLKLAAGRALVLGAVLFLVASQGARATDPTAVEFIPGFWAGFSQSLSNPGPIQSSFLNITSTDRHRGFGGALTIALGDGSVRVLCDGSVSQANVLNLQGKSSDGLIIVVCHGQI